MSSVVSDNMNHICTIRSLELDLPPSKCLICKHKTLYHGWCDSNCRTCGATLSSESTMPDILRQIRHKAKLKRSHVAELMNVKPNTVTTYETCKCSQIYFDRFVLYIKNMYSI